MSSALLRADIAATDELMEVPWFENAVTADKSGWDGYGLVCSDAKYTFYVDSPLSFRPTAHTGNAVRQVFDLDLKPVHELPAVDDGAQTAFVMLVTETGHVIMAWGRSTPGDMAATWHELGIPVYGRKLAVEIDYSAGEDVPAVIRYYLTDDNGDTQLGPSLYSANTQVQVTQYDFTGSGTLSSLVGTQTADTAAIIDGVKYSASEITSERLVEALASGVVKVFDSSLVPEGYAVNDNHELYSTGEDPGGGDPEEDDPVEPEEPKKEMLYYFPLEGTVENVGGTRGDQDLTVGEALDWDDDGWTGSPFGEKSLRSSSSETKVYNAAGLVATGSQWTVSFWTTACRENWDWKDACAFRIGENVFRVEKTNAKELQVYGSGGEYLNNPIVCGDDWVNISVVCNSELNAVDLYVGGAHHESMAVADADRLTGFYFSAYGFRDDPTWSQNFVDEVSIWNCALNADQLAHLAGHPATAAILEEEPPTGWAGVSESTLFSEIPGLTDGQREALAAKGITPLRLAGWAIAKEIVYGEVVDVEAFAMNCSPADKADEAAKLKLVIETVDGEPKVSIVNGTDGETVTRNWNIQPTVKGKVELSDESWGNKDAEGVRFFRAFLCL